MNNQTAETKEKTMQNLDVLRTEQASPEAQGLFELMLKKYGKVPNLYAVTANSATTLRAVLDYGDALEAGELTPKEVEAIALAVSEDNGCTYCLAAHTAIGKMLGFSEEETLSIRSGRSDDSKLNALIGLAKEITATRGWPAQGLVDGFFAVGYSKAALIELIGFVSLNVFKNYQNHIAHTPIDFPDACPLESGAVA